MAVPLVVGVLAIAGRLIFTVGKGYKKLATAKGAWNPAAMLNGYIVVETVLFLADQIWSLIVHSNRNWWLGLSESQRAEEQLRLTLWLDENHDLIEGLSKKQIMELYLETEGSHIR